LFIHGATEVKTKIACAIVLSVPALLAQTAQHNTAIPLSKVEFAQDEDVECLSSGIVSGDPASGPSTILLKAPAGCLVRWHYHTAEEQLMVVQGDVLTEMEGMAPTLLGPGGFGFMESRAKHQFTCTSATECLLFVTFDRAYDIFWGAPTP
jgi:quercetin dioxygenase-like cupin family protein